MYFALLIRRLHRGVDLLHRIRFSRNRIGSFHALSRRFQRLGFNARIGFARFHDRLGFPFGFARHTRLAARFKLSVVSVDGKLDLFHH